MADAIVNVVDSQAVVQPFGTEPLLPLVQAASGYAGNAQASADAAANSATTIGTTISTGTSSSAGGLTISGSTTVLDGTPMAQAGGLNNLRQYFTGAGWAIPWIGKLNVDGLKIDPVMIGAAVTVTGAGEVAFPDFTPTVDTTHYVGFITDGQIVSYNNSVAGKNIWQVGTGGQVPSAGATKAELTGKRLAISYDVTSGTRGQAIQNATSARAADFAASDTPITVGPIPMTDGTNGYNGGYTVARREPAPRDGFVKLAAVQLAAAGAGYVAVISRNANGKWKLESKTPTGSQGATPYTSDSIYLPIKAGQFVAEYSTAGVRYSVGGVGGYYVLGEVGSDTAMSVDTTNTPRIAYQIVGSIPGERGRAAAAETGLQTQMDGTLLTQGVYPAVDGGNSPGSGGLCIFFNEPIADNGTLPDFQFWAAAASAGQLVLGSRGTNSISTVDKQDITAVAGGPTVVKPKFKDAKGLYLGILLSSGAGIRYAPTGGPGAFWTNGLPGTNTATTGNTTWKPSMGWKVQTGLTPRVRALEGASGSDTGLGLFSEADRTGAADVTTVFASARSQHAAPYVPPGTYAVTSLANYGDGFWAPPRGTDVRVNGVHYPLPTSPTQGSLLLRARSAYSGLHGLGLPLVLIGDSLSDAAHTPGSRAAHWFSMHTAWLNNEFAPGGEPVLAVLNDVPAISLTKTYFGITVSGGTALDSGPVGSAVILAAGDYIEFTGAYGEVDVFYNQKAGAGSLAWTYNAGSAYKTLSCAGATSLDLYSGPSATGQAASGAYRITAGGGPVEVTGLVRDGIQVSAAYAGKKLKSMRPAIGGASCATFSNTRLTSIETQVAQCSGGQTAAEYIVGLHTNDLLSATASPRATAYEAGMNRIIDHLQASGAGRINWLIPPHFRSDVGSSPEAGDSFEKFTAIAERVCRQQGVYLFRGDYIDAAGLGLMADAVHPGAALNMLMADEYSRWRVATA